MKSFLRYFDIATLATIVITFILFVVSLFLKGFTHELFLEAGVFLISVKLVMMSYRHREAEVGMEGSLKDIKETLRRMESRNKS